MLIWDGIATPPCVCDPFVSVPFQAWRWSWCVIFHACMLGQKICLSTHTKILFFYVHILSPSPHSSPPQICNFPKLWVWRLETWAVMPDISCLLLWTHNSHVSRCSCPSFTKFHKPWQLQATAKVTQQPEMTDSDYHNINCSKESSNNMW